jgi:O-antigen/teichoic acid export membrane protein
MQEPSSIDRVRPGVRQIRRHLRTIAAEPRVLALVDQAVVSGSSFVTTVLIGRWTNPSELAWFAIAMSVLISLLSIQESLIAIPYMILRPRQLGTEKEAAGDALIQCGALSGAVTVLLSFAALWSLAFLSAPQFAAVAWALALITPFALLRDFGRRYAFTRLRVHDALKLDIAAASIQFPGLCLLAWTGHTSTADACLVIGAASAVPGIAWLRLVRGEFALRVSLLGRAMRQSWNIGKWLLAGQITVSMQGYAALWMLPTVLGTRAAGIFAACASIVACANPLIAGFGNILLPRAVLALQRGGAHRLQSQSVRDSLLLGSAMALFCAAIFLAGSTVLSFLFGATDYGGQDRTLTALALAAFATAVGIPASNALAALERPSDIFCAGLGGVGTTILLLPWMTHQWGLTGTAYAIVLGNTIGAAGRWLALRGRLSDPRISGINAKQSATAATVVEALAHVTDDRCAQNLSVTPLGKGCQSYVFVAESRNSRPILGVQQRLVVKLYHSANSCEIYRAQLECKMLHRLRGVLDARYFSGWRTCSPAPIHLCMAPLALVMTVVPGTSLNTRLEERGGMPPHLLQSAAQAIVAAMKLYWSTGHSYGDLDFNNILCDVGGRHLSFVDPGMPGDYCRDVSGGWFPASHDLGYMLYATETNLKHDIRAPRARMRKRGFAASIVRAYVGSLEAAERDAALDEINACAQAHLRRLGWNWSGRGAWRWILKEYCCRRINATIGALKAELEPPTEGVQCLPSSRRMPRVGHARAP